MARTIVEALHGFGVAETATHDRPAVDHQEMGQDRAGQAVHLAGSEALARGSN